MSVYSKLLLVLLLLIPSNLLANPAFIAGTTITLDNASNATSKTPINTTGATFITVLVTRFGTGGTALITDNPGNTYSLSRTIYATSAENSVQFWYIFSPTTSATHSFSVLTSSSAATGTVAAFSDVTSYELENGNTSVAASVTTISPGNVTSTFSNSLVLTGVGWNLTAGVVSVDSGFTIAAQTPAVTGTNYGSALAYKITTTAASLTPIWTLPGSDVASSNIASFKSSASTSGASTCGSFLLLGVGC